MLYDPETQTLYRNQSEAKKLSLPKVSTAPRPDVDAGQVAVRDDMPTEQGDGSWRFEWAVERMSDAQIIKGIKAEAHRRITAIVPEWKQRNLLAQASLLAEKGRANWTTAETAAWEAGEAVWAQVEAIRAASNALEEMSPLPTDFTDDNYWP